MVVWTNQFMFSHSNFLVKPHTNTKTADFHTSLDSYPPLLCVKRIFDRTFCFHSYNPQISSTVLFPCKLVLRRPPQVTLHFILFSIHHSHLYICWWHSIVAPTAQALQVMFDSLSYKIRSLSLKINAQKSCHNVFCHKNRKIFSDLKIYNQTLKTVTECKHLGFVLSDDLSCTKDVEKS